MSWPKAVTHRLGCGNNVGLRFRPTHPTRTSPPPVWQNMKSSRRASGTKTIYPFGAAMGRPDSPHYSDQAEMFSKEEFKDSPLPVYE